MMLIFICGFEIHAVDWLVVSWSHSSDSGVICSRGTVYKFPTFNPLESTQLFHSVKRRRVSGGQACLGVLYLALQLLRRGRINGHLAGMLEMCHNPFDLQDCSKTSKVNKGVGSKRRKMTCVMIVNSTAINQPYSLLHQRFMIVSLLPSALKSHI